MKFPTTIYFSSFVTSKERAETLSELMKAPTESGLFRQRLVSLCLHMYKEKSQKTKTCLTLGWQGSGALPVRKTKASGKTVPLQ